MANDVILHARTAYEDHDDPALKRHLLRLWLSLEQPDNSLKLKALRHMSRWRLLGSLVRAKIVARV